MVYLPPFVLSGTLAVKDEAEFVEFATLYRRAIESLRDGRFEVSDFTEVSHLNEILESSPASH